MVDNFFRNYKKLLLFFITASVVYWVGITFFSLSDTFFTIFGFLLFLLPLATAIYGFYVSKQWGGFKSHVGKSITFASISMIMWAMGQGIYLLYSIFSGEVPFPGPPDFFFIFLDPFYALAILSIMQYSGATNKMGKTSLSYLILMIIPLASLYINFKVFFGEFSLDVFSDLNIFDLIYTFGSIILMALVSITLIFSIGKLGGRMKVAVYLFFFGFIFQYIGDLLYSLLEAQPDTFPINGNQADFIFFVSIACIALAFSRFNIDLLGKETTRAENNA